MWKQIQHQILYYQRQLMSTSDMECREVYVSVIRDLRGMQIEIEREFLSVR